MGGVASSTSALGPGRIDGDIGYVRVSQGGESHMQRLIWDALASKWVSEILTTPVEGTDGDWMMPTGNLATDWKYMGSANTELAKWSLVAGSIPFAGALIAAGLRLQDRFCARLLDAGGTIWVSPWYYEYNDGDPIVFSNDVGAQGAKTWNGHADLGFEPSPENIGHGAVIKSDGTSTAKVFGAAVYDDNITSSPYHALTRNAGWDYVNFYVASAPAGAALGGVPTTVPYTPTKKYLYPTLYGIMPNGSGMATPQYEVRWTS